MNKLLWFFLCLYVLGLTASQELTCVNKYVGDSYTMTLNSPEQDGDMLVWKCSDKVIYKRRKGKIDPTADVDMQGSLTLTNISKSMACTYKAEHHDKARTPDPKLEVECSLGVATLQCGPKSSPEGITLTWFHNNIEMTNETSTPLKPQKPGPRDRYKCRLSNGHDMKDSNEETVSCEVSDGKLICIEKQVMVVVLAGVGFLLLVWTLLLVIVSCRNCGHQKRKHDSEELWAHGSSATETSCS
ncbi:uncharacterized protein LOC143141990 isoform X2 [Alosa pseudoharengus]|uniref:uncharacterized protein LOC143141990 isoform X2 n=1 Tax=Alosa pseudoharengus TaxID=34774 RepID=UPI003F88FAF6